jgi:hypothetical protein
MRAVSCDHLNFQSFAEYPIHLILATKGCKVVSLSYQLNVLIFVVNKTFLFCREEGEIIFSACGCKQAVCCL